MEDVAADASAASPRRLWLLANRPDSLALTQIACLNHLETSVDLLDARDIAAKLGRSILQIASVTVWLHLELSTLMPALARSAHSVCAYQVSRVSGLKPFVPCARVPV